VGGAKPWRTIVAFILAGIGLGWWLATRASLLAPTLAHADAKKILLLHVGTEPSALDPQQVRGIPESKILSCLFEGLVIPDPGDSTKQLPGVADRWEHNEDSSVWTFHLRADARWSNGDPVTANDFAFSIQRILTPELGAFFADYLYIIRRGEDFHKGKIKDFSQVGVRVVDPHTLRLELIGPTPYLLSALTNYYWFPVHPATILRFGKLGDRSTRWTLPDALVGNGPFVLKTWKANDVIETVRNPFYWNDEAVKLNGVNFYSIEELNTADRAFRAGQLHTILDVPLDKTPFYRREHSDLIHLEPYAAVYFYRINIAQKPLNDVRVRQALSLAIDRASLVHNVLRGDQRPATGVTPPGFPDYPPVEITRYDPEKARSLLTEAGYPGGAGFPTISILINTSEAHRSIAEAIQQMWREELNISVQIENQEWKVYLQSVHQHHFAIARAGWVAGFLDPLAVLNIWKSDSPNNDSGWADPQYDSLLQEAAVTGDSTARLAKLRQAEEILVRDAPLLPIYWYTRVYLLDPAVTGWHANLEDKHFVQFLDLQPGIPLR
jgi:oligopeptide transport system substrate-binding protein